MRRWRRNADEPLRRLERAAAAGDPEAQVTLIAHKLRLRLIDSMSVAEKVALRRAVADSLRDQDMEVSTLEEIGDWARRALVRESAWGRAPRWGWFPLHTNNLVCPRGHHNAGRNGPFQITNGCTIETPAELDQDHAYVDYDQEDLTGHIVALICSTCAAQWPLDGDVTWLDD